MRCSIIILVVALLAFSRCKKPGCFETAGRMVTTERAASPFHQIDLNDKINLILTQDTTEKIKVEAGEHLQPNVSTTIKDGILTIDNNTHCNWLRNPSENINVYVSVKSLEKVLYNGSGNITSTNTLKGDNLGFYSRKGAGNIDVLMDVRQAFAYIYSENADFRFSGKVDVCWSYTNARGSIDFSNLQVKKYIIEYGGVRDTYIQVSEDIDAIIYHTGNLYYKGNPAKIKTVYHHTGRLIHQP